MPEQIPDPHRDPDDSHDPQGFSSSPPVRRRSPRRVSGRASPLHGRHPIGADSAARGSVRDSSRLGVRPLGTIPENLFEPTSRRELLEHLAEHDGVAIFERVANALGKKGYLLDPSALALRVLGALAVALEHGKSYESTVDALVDRVIDEGASESRQGRDRELNPPGEVSLLGSTQKARDACRAFNNIPQIERIALYRIVVLGEALAAVAKSTGEDVENLRLRAARALDLVTQAMDAPDRPSMENR